jgi:hypothetical protein
MPVNSVRKELHSMLTLYWIIRDCLEGEPAIKGWLNNTSGTNISMNAAAFNGGGSGIANTNLPKAKFYLPQPNPADQSEANNQRYKQYLARAVFYNVTARTLEGMIGQIFLIPPVIKLPKGLEMMLKDMDGDGLSFEQSSKRAVRYDTAYGRGGLFVDYPKTDGLVTQAQIDSGEVKPIIKLIAPWNIINWRTSCINGKCVLTQLVIREEIDSYDEDGFGVSIQECYKVLQLDDVTQIYTIQSYDGVPLTKGISSNRFAPGEIITPTDSKGNSFKYIPFTFFGSENNDSAVDRPPMYDLATLNIGHYRNSADYEECSFMMGQPTVWASGIDQTWYKEVLKEVIPVGSRAGIPLPEGASIGLLQANPNTMPLEAMKLKEDQMLALGAKLVTQKRTQRTATETKFDASSETSVLTNVANNVSAAYIFAFKAACAFTGDNQDEVDVKLNTQFELNDLTPDDLSKIVATWIQGAIGFSEMRETMRKSGIATLDDAAAKTEIEQNRKDGLIPPAAVPKGVGGAPNPNTDPAGHAGTASS